MTLKYIMPAVFFIMISFTLAASQQVQDREKIEKILDAYKSEKCSFSDLKLSLFKIERVAKDEKGQNLTRETAEGIKSVSRTDGYQLIFVQETDKYLFANFRIDRSKPGNYESDKKITLGHLEKINSGTQGMETLKPIAKNYNGFASYSSNRKDIYVGDTVGITILFDDKNKIIMTVYFINMPPKVKSEFKLFNNIQEWKNTSDKFLNSYTKCVNANLKNL